jgi:hypothetical protein
MKKILVIEDQADDLDRLLGIVKDVCPEDEVMVYCTLEQAIEHVFNSAKRFDRAILDMGICLDESARSVPDIDHGVNLLIHLVSVKQMSKESIRIVTVHPESVEEMLRKEEEKYRAKVLSKALHPVEYRRQLEGFLR